jgi:hypothetical protein
LANCWLACGPGAPKPLAKQRKAGLKVSNDAKKEKRPKKYLGFSIILACGSFQRTCETSLQTWEEIETSAESILRASLITGFPSKKHWNRDRRIIVEPAAPLCFSANILEHLVVCHSPSGMLQGCNSRGPVFHVRSQTGTNVSLEASEKHKKKMDQGQKDNEKKSRVYSMTTYILPGIM